MTLTTTIDDVTEMTGDERIARALTQLEAAATRVTTHLAPLDFILTMREQGCLDGLIDAVHVARTEMDAVTRERQRLGVLYAERHDLAGGRLAARSLCTQLADALDALATVAERAGLSDEPALAEAHRVGQVAARIRRTWRPATWLETTCAPAAPGDRQPVQLALVRG